MAEMDLLKANFTGKLGALSGANWKGRPVIKAAPFSKAPPSAIQTNSVRAFECLNRLSSAIAEVAFPYLNLSDKKMLRHNAVAHWLKPLVATHSFEPDDLVSIIPEDDDLNWFSLILNTHRNDISLKISLGKDYVPITGSREVVIFFDDLGHTYFNECFEPEDYAISFPFLYDHARVYYGLAFLSDPAPKGRKIHGLAFRSRFNLEYSFDEEHSGDVWIGDLAVYMKTWMVLAPVMTGVGNYTVLLDTLQITNLLKAEFVHRTGYDVNRLTCDEIGLNNGTNLSFFNLVYNPDTQQLSLNINVTTDTLAQRYSQQKVYVTAYYTKD